MNSENYNFTQLPLEVFKYKVKGFKNEDSVCDSEFY